MKKVFLLFTVAVACFAVSCKKEIKGEVLTPEKSKETLDETMTKAVGLLEVDNWQETADLITASAVALESIEGTDKSAEDWSEALEAAWNSEKDGIEIYTVDLEKVQGNLYVKDNKWYASEGKGLTVTYPLEDGTEVKGTMTVKNSKNKVLVDENYDYYDANGNFVEAGILRSKEYVIIPESINGNITAGGKQAASVKISTDIDMAGELPTLNDKFSATMAVSANDYTFSVTRAKYSNTEVVLDASIKYGKTTVVAAKFEAKGKIEAEADGDLDYMASTGKANVSFKVLDNVELKGDLNWTEFKNLINTDIKSEEDAKALAASAEKNVHLTLYIQNTAQSKLGWEPYQPAIEEGQDFWSVQPVIRFEDGSQYMLPEEFFSADGFPKTVEAINNALAEMAAFLSGPENEK